jgi:hypothetical protein
MRRGASKVGFGLACALVVALEAVAVAGWQGWLPARNIAGRLAHPRAPEAVTVAATTLPAPHEARLPAAPAAPPAQDRYYDELRGRINWVSARIGTETLPTPDADSRMLLVKSAAHRAGLHEVGLSFKDVYGIINAETSWIPRLGASRDGTPNLGIAQFEPATARLLGMRDPNDPVESVHVAALHMKEAALWSRDRIAGLRLDAAERAARLREGVSIYYNLSSRGRAAWNGQNTRKLPRETQLHIQNARIGAMQADVLEAQLDARNSRWARVAPVITAANGQGER